MRQGDLGISSHVIRQPGVPESPFQRVSSSLNSGPTASHLRPAPHSSPALYQNAPSSFQPGLSRCVFHFCSLGTGFHWRPGVCVSHRLISLRIGRSEDRRFLLPLPPSPSPRVLWRKGLLLAVSKRWQGREMPSLPWQLLPLSVPKHQIPASALPHPSKAWPDRLVR